MSHKHDHEHHGNRKCHTCRERDRLTPVAGGFTLLCRHCLMDAELVKRLEQAARQAGFEPEKQIALF